MKKLLIFLVVIAAVVAVYYYRTPANAPEGIYATPTPAVTQQPAVTKTPAPTVSKTPLGTPVHQSSSIRISNFAFLPAALTVKVGSTVTWTNEDSAPHRLQSDSGSVIATTTMSLGDSVSVTFSAPGTYWYHCSIHPGMKGSITVQ